MATKRIIIIAVAVVLTLLLAVIILAYFLTQDTNFYVYTNTTSGPLKGRILKSPQDDDVEVFLGIPYAKPPIGSLRFVDPVSFPYSKDELSAVHYGNSCPQLIDDLFGDFHGSDQWNPKNKLSEDCLTVNVWVPKPRKEKRAVLVWIYGGGFYSGSSALRIYNGIALAAHSDLIVVSFNYRLGVFGFFTTGDERIQGNFGLKDQQLALGWIQKNIASFGGDPNNVTLIGESAGSASVGYHVLLPSSSSYFNRAILTSGSPSSPWATLPLDLQRKATTYTLEELGCKDDSKVLECLQTKETSNFNLWMPSEMGTFWKPVVDGVFITDHPRSLFESGRFNEKPLLVGVTKDEGSYFAVYFFPNMSIGKSKEPNKDYVPTFANFRRDVNIMFRRFNATSRDKIYDYYSRNWNTNTGIQMSTDGYFLCPLQEILNAARKHEQDTNVYHYQLTYRASNNPWPKWTGVMHADDVQWYFGVPLDDKMGYSEEDVQFSKQFMDLVSDFAKHGRMTGKDHKLDWPSYNEHQELMELGGPNNIVVKQGPLQEDACEFWTEQIYEN